MHILISVVLTERFAIPNSFSLPIVRPLPFGLSTPYLFADRMSRYEAAQAHYYGLNEISALQCEFHVAIRLMLMDWANLPYFHL